jgi:hypothetical protein
MWSPWVLATTIAVPLGSAYLLLAPPSADLAAASYRSDLFSRAGLALWDNGWYAGHHLLGYSMLAPVLGWLLGVRLLIALAVLVATGLFSVLARKWFGRTAGCIASVWFAIGAGVGLLSGRVAYDLGAAIGLAALLAWLYDRRILAICLAILTSLASPVAGAFLALAGVADALGCGPRRAGGLWLAAGALLPVIAFALAFPEGGYEPFAPSAFWPALAGVILLGLLLPSRWRSLRVGAGLYALASIGSFAIHTPVGGNTARLGSLLAGPLAAGVLWDPRRKVLLALAPVLLYWQLATPIRDLVAVAGDPSVNASYYKPLLDALGQRVNGTPVRVEVPLTGAHWEAAYLPGHQNVSLARGWERQLDTRYASLFYRSSLSALAYRRWLSSNAISYVAVPDTRLDGAGKAEGKLIAQGLSFLTEVWHSKHWRLYTVLGAQPLAQAPGALTGLQTDSFALKAPRAGTYEIRVHFTPYWALVSGQGCVGRGSEGWTEVDVRRPGTIKVAIDFSLTRVFDHSARCRLR